MPTVVAVYVDLVISTSTLEGKSKQMFGRRKTWRNQSLKFVWDDEFYNNYYSNSLIRVFVIIN